MSRILVITCAVLAVFVAKANAVNPPESIRAAICAEFGPYCGQALAVSWCESRFDVNARNGQYLGLFQMGNHERATYGHGPTAREQARAAFRYFRATRYTWKPWTCKPWS